MVLLQVQQVSKYFGGLAALSRVDFQIQKGDLVALIGPNGAGKTTLFNVISGFHSPSAGNLILKGENITGLSPDKIAKKGIVRTFQHSSLLMESTVLKNVISAHYLRRKTGFWKPILNTRSASKERDDVQKDSESLLSFFNFTSLNNELAKNLPHGQQRLLGIAIALAARPELLLLDEPATGMNPEESRALMVLIRRIVDMGTTVLIVEHDMKLVMGLANRISVLNYGNIIAEGSPYEIGRNELVIEAYLGSKEEA